jgi:hypothetical protein
MKHRTQQERILDVLRSLQTDDCNIPQEYLRCHKSADGISARYFKLVMLISETNGRISEPRAEL